VAGDLRRRVAERLWIFLFIVVGFLFALLAPPVMGVPLAVASAGLGTLDAYVHRRLVGGQWLAAAAIFGVLWVALSMTAVLTGAASGLAVFRF
jgi:hypothetical protein